MVNGSLSLCNYLYSISLAFQVAGAILIILKYWGNTEQRIIEEYLPGKCIFTRDNNDNIILEIAKVKLCAKRIYKNRISFIFIAFGYFLSVFGNSNGCDLLSLAIILCGITCIILLVEYYFTNFLVDINYRADILIPYLEVADCVDVEASDSEIKEIFK